MGKHSIPVIKEWCRHCDSSFEIKGTMRWHKCPFCGNYIRPCSICPDFDKHDCANICPLNGKPKPTEKIGGHTISELVDNGEYLDLVFDWESDNKNSDGESFKIHVNLDLEDGSVRIYEERFDLNMNLIDFFECRNHITDHEAKLAVRRLRKVALKLERI